MEDVYISIVNDIEDDNEKGGQKRAISSETGSETKDLIINIINSSFASSKISISSTNYSAPMKVCKNQRIHIIRYSRA